jgi:outer membrane receptor protein involved in Fe transport
MKQILSLTLIFLFSISVFGQEKTRGKVKRKYRDVEQIAQTQPPVFLRGSVYDQDNIPVAGANVTVDGTVKGVNTNEFGEFLIENLVTGKARIRVSFVGYATKTTDLEMRVGENYKDIMLTMENIHLEPVTVNAQKREQQILDVPAAISAVTANTLERSNITELGPLSEFVPGLYIREQGANRPSFVIRGLSSEEVSASAQPRVSVFSNNVPINRANGASVELFDMERVEVLKGPQNTLFGRGAQTGAVHFISKMPGNTTEGYLTAGFGNYNQKEFRAAVNVPVIDDKLFVRAAGIYNARDGYIENTFGGDLNGKNTMAGRFSARYLPAYNHKIDLVLNYQKDETPGIAFMSKQFPNTNGVTDVFSGTASLEQGENLGTGKDFFDATLNYKYFINENTSWSSITSYRNGNSNARWDGDGTASASIDMAETSGAEQFYQEIRGNFSQNSRLIGSVGASYWWEKAGQKYWFSPNEQHFASIMFFRPPMPVWSDGQPVVIPALPNVPQMGPLAGMPLPVNHQEENWSNATNQSAEVFMDATYQLRRKLFISFGVRGVFDMYKLSNKAVFTSGEPSVLGYFTGNAPNLFFKESVLQTISKNTLSVTGKAGLQYKLNEYGNFFVNYARGRRPNVLQFTATGEEEILDAEILDNFDAGFKASVLERVFIDAVGFYQKYKNFQSSAWIADPATGEFNYKTIDGGKATTYGAEATLNVAVVKQLDIFGNYAWLHTAFDSTNTDGLEQEYAGDRFALAPEHSFTAGFNAQVNLTKNLQLFVSPSYSYKTHIYFTDANTEGIDQEAYGLLNLNGGIKLSEPKLILSVYATNLLDEQYVTSGGNTGSLFGVPTFVPGAPQMFGAKVTWAF